MKLTAKFIIKGKIKAITGLHIGGSSTGLDIGGLDNSVIKNAMGVPYIPGSSLKGKLRSIIEKIEHTDEIKTDKTGLHLTGIVPEIFGKGANKKDNEQTRAVTRFYARDSFMSSETRTDMEEKDGVFQELEFDYTESKMENVISRKTGTSGNLRTLERVPAGAKFDFEFIIDQYDGDNNTYIGKVLTGMKLLQDDYIGGSGSRGYGQIEFQIDDLTIKTIEDYEKGTNGTSYIQWDEKEELYKEIKEKIKSFTGE